MDLNFTKWAGAGNDFILVDWRRKKNLPTGRWRTLAQNLCDRKHAIGADGLLVLEPSRKTDFRMRIFNPDGSEAEMCGNGSRCAALYAVGRSRGHVSFETLAGHLEASVRGDTVKVKLPDPHSFRRGLKARLCGRTLTLHGIVASVPHAILFVENLEKFDVECWGESIRHHRLFRPRGANADFVKVRGKQFIEIRTYERGVEGETLACGTGATASALVVAKLKGFRSPITVLTKGGERLKIYFRRNGNTFQDVSLEGKVSKIFEGSVKDV